MFKLFFVFWLMICTQMFAIVSLDTSTGIYTVDTYGLKNEKKGDFSNLLAQTIQEDREQWIIKKPKTPPSIPNCPTPLPPKNPPTPLPPKNCPTPLPDLEE